MIRLEDLESKVLSYLQLIHTAIYSIQNYCELILSC